MTNYDEVCRECLVRLVREVNAIEEVVEAISGEESVNISAISPEFFQLPSRDYAVMSGEERIVECHFRKSSAHVFTSVPLRGCLKIKDIIKADLSNIVGRTLFYCLLNVVMKQLGYLSGTLHCRGFEPVMCAELLADKLKRSGAKKVLLIGYQPAMVDALVKNIETLYVTDMNPKNIGKVVHGVGILSHTLNLALISEVDAVIATGSALINNTLWQLYEEAKKLSKRFIVYGVSAAGASRIFNIERHCPFSR